MSFLDEFLSTPSPAPAATLPLDQPQAPSCEVTGRDLLVIFFATLFACTIFVGAAAGLLLLLLLYPEISFDEKSPWIAIFFLALGHTTPMAIAWLRMRGRWTTAAQWGLVQFRWVYVPLGIVLGGLLAGLGDLFESDNFGVAMRGNLAPALILGLLAAVGAPFVEELLFRGLLYRWLVQRFRIWFSVVVSALVFAAFHVGGGWAQIGFAALVGVVFAVLFQIQKSLWPCIIAHGTINFVFVLALYLGWR